jgi:hypothetical protein
MTKPDPGTSIGTSDAHATLITAANSPLVAARRHFVARYGVQCVLVLNLKLGLLALPDQPIFAT